ncbi:hypothetical protein BCV72DRAFT_331084 [Rhizopus microsporus var. microsporus]|uniref:Uncharacterized protein n=1 Tax=Rhizopus microsporus var. microsporus TaxID=86635 RepID=A0A1X0R078_RHIZD|nr:hypothetical protein BCV72DRAFT_331084 [Rhizopus microsporus var. microsporus]
MLEYSQRLLLIIGKEIVDNLLLLSMTLHCLRTITVPFSFLQALQSIVIRFLSHRYFLFVSHEVCLRPRKEGEPIVLSPGTQFCALQLRWLDLFWCFKYYLLMVTPLIYQYCAIVSVPSLTWLILLYLWYLKTSDCLA